MGMGSRREHLRPGRRPFHDEPAHGDPRCAGGGTRPSPTADGVVGLEVRRGLLRQSVVAHVAGQRVEELAAIQAGELRYQAEAARRAESGEQSGRGKQFALGIVSLSLGVPITAITGTGMESGNLIGMAIAWAGIVGVNLAHALSLRKRRS